MDRVNLLPEEAKLSFQERLLLKVDRDFPRVLAVTSGSLIIFGIIASIGYAVSLSGKEKRLESLKKEIHLLEVEGQNLELFTKQLDQIGQELDRQKKTIEWKIGYLKSTKDRPRLWAGILKDLRQNIPHGVWLTELETGNSQGLRISGGAPNEDLVTQFMGNLKSSTRFTNVGFSFTEKDTIGNVPIVKFEIVCQVGA